MFRPIFFAVATAALVAGCTTGGPMAATATGSRVTVTGAGDDLLKLRSGPGLEYKVLLGLPDGTALRRRDCVTELGQLWCRVALADAPQVTGFVSADYLTSR